MCVRCVGACLNSSNVLALAVGTVKIPMEQIYAAVISQLQSGTSLDGALKGSVHDIVWQLRLPRIVLAAAVGAGLASSGVIMQAIVKTPSGNNGYRKSLNATVVAAIHDLNIAAMYCDRLIAIRNGLVVGVGTPQELLTEEFIYDMYSVHSKVTYDAESGRMNIIYLPKHWRE